MATGRRREDILGLRVTDVKTAGDHALVFEERVVLQKEAVLTANQAQILEALVEPIVDGRGGAAKLLAEKTDRAGTDPGLFDLEGKGLVVREVKGRRTYRIETTEAGRAVLERRTRRSGRPGCSSRRSTRTGVPSGEHRRGDDAAVLAQIERLRRPGEGPGDPPARRCLRVLGRSRGSAPLAARFD